MTIFDITTDPGPYPQPWGLLDDDAQTINDADTSTLPQARITAFKMYELMGGGATGITDDDAIHDNVSAEISAITEKVTPVSADLVVIEDSAAANAKKRVQVGNLPGGDITTDPAFDAKGDLIVGTGADTAARLAIGANDTIPIADSAEATGIRWGAQTGGGGGELTYKELASFDYGTTASNSDDVDVTGYDVVEIRWTDVGFAASDGLRLRTSSDGFSSDLGNGASDYSIRKLDDNENTASASSEMNIAAGSQGTSSRSGIVRLSGISSASEKTIYEALATGGTGSPATTIRTGYRDDLQTDTHIRIFSTNTNNMNAGRLRVLGIGKSTSDGVGEEVKRCRATMVADETTANYTTLTAINFDAEDFDVGGWHDNVTNNERVTVPADAKNEVDIHVYVGITSIASTDYALLQLYKDGALYKIDGGFEDGFGQRYLHINLPRESVIPGTTYFEARLQVESDTSVTVLSESNITIAESTTTHGTNGALIPSASTPDANIQGVIGQIDVITTTSMTANRDYLLPATASVGDRCGVHCVNDEPDHEILIKTPSASGDQIDGVDHSTNELTRLFIAGESMEFECIDAAGPHWRTMKDGRKPCRAEIHLTAVSPSVTADTFTAWSAFDTNGSAEGFDIGSIMNATDGRTTIRRDNPYAIYATVRVNTALGADGEVILRVLLDPDGTPIHVCGGEEFVGAAATSAVRGSNLYEFSAGNVLELEAWRSNSGALYGSATDRGRNTQYSIIEQLG